MKCKECIHANVCANNSIIETKYVANELLTCPDFEPANLFYKMPCPEGTVIYRIDFEWRCDTQHCPYEGWRDCTECGNGKNKSEIVTDEYKPGIHFGFRYHKTKEEAEEYLKNCSDEDIKDYASMC